MKSMIHLPNLSQSCRVTNRETCIQLQKGQAVLAADDSLYAIFLC